MSETHREHCCYHECSFREEDCPVTNHKVKPRYFCGHHGEPVDNSGIVVYCVDFRYFDRGNGTEESTLVHTSSSIGKAVDWIKENGESYDDPTIYEAKFVVFGMITDMEQDFNFVEYFNLDGSRKI